ncbi:MAG: PilZ domain-containing protein [Novosphingobium sp.]
MRRREDRKPLAMNALCRTGAERKTVKLWDLSSRGCRIFMTGMNLCEGQRIVLRPDGMESFDATVRWASDDFAGIEFDRPLHPAVVDHLCRLHPDEDRIALELAA